MASHLMNKICDLFGFKQRKYSMYHAAANGLAEAFNETLCNLLKKVVSKSKRDWHERMEEALWAYRTTYRTPTQATPYSLAYGVKAVLPLELQIPSLRLAIQEGLTKEENARLHLTEFEALDEKRPSPNADGSMRENLYRNGFLQRDDCSLLESGQFSKSKFTNLSIFKLKSSNPPTLQVKVQNHYICKLSSSSQFSS
ncbi:uncharacterized protein LOC132630499 [Lycium barbarum]|uniref:uncharacterized protein LOC132630499 n=1 Tax=Lycium barbarum TaxID=112863 RepID=UPI00293E6714|nr:uncharacterized protein LOC132630499 [Lycium barbarum]